MTNDPNSLIVSYLTLRRVVGFLGVMLPIVLALLGFLLTSPPALRDSISAYYDLRTRDVLVGVLFTLAWFFFTYHGHDNRDNIAGYFAWLFALGVALFPASGSPREKIVHFVSATGLFIVLSIFSLVLFTKSAPTPTPQKVIRNRIYRTCGYLMLACIVLIGLYHAFWKHTALATWKPVFWLESLALWAFGISWFVKGETLWRDPPPA
jgi:hypothetical protein